MDIQNPSIHFSTINTIRNNAITNWYNADWLSVVSSLIDQKHTVSETKDVVLMSPWQYKTFEQGALPRLTEDGTPWLIDDKLVVARLADNVLGTDVLMLDFDGGMTIAQAKSVFATWAHFGYTSYSHMSAGKNHADCFRVVLPLAQFVSAEDLVRRRKAIYAQFPGIDISCLSLARSFYLPSCPPDRAHLAHMWDNHAELFDVFEYDADAPIEMFASPSINRPVDKQKIIESLKSFYVGHEPTWFNVAVAMASNGFTEQDFCEVTIGCLMKEKNTKQCTDKWKSAKTRISRGKTMTIGYLINLCKDHNAWKTETKQEQRQKMIADQLGGNHV